MATTQILQGFGFASYPVNVQGIQTARQDALASEAALREVRARLAEMRFSNDPARIDSYINQVQKALHSVNLALSDWHKVLDSYGQLLAEVVKFHQQLGNLIKDAQAAAKRMRVQAQDALRQNALDEADSLLQQAAEALEVADGALASQRELVNAAQLAQSATRAATNMAAAMLSESRATVARLKTAQTTAVNAELSEQLRRSMELNDRLLKKLLEKSGGADGLFADLAKLAKGAAVGVAGILLLLAAAWAISMRPKRGK